MISARLVTQGGPGACLLRPRLLLPRYWPTWTAIFLSRLLHLLPVPRLLALGRVLGSLLHRLDPELAATARCNIALTLPELRPAARARLLDQHFESLGMALTELSLAWWSTPAELAALVRVEGLDHLRSALAQGRGVILLSAHFTSVELASRVLAFACPTPLGFFCRPANNEALAYALQRFRRRYGGYHIAGDDASSAVRALRRNECVWYAPDRAACGRGSVMARVFGIPAACSTQASRLARDSGAPVLPYFFQRLRGGQGYLATVHAPLERFPGPCLVADVERINRLIEAQVRVVPEQYVWIHRRFTGLDEAYPDYYGHR